MFGNVKSEFSMLSRFGSALECRLGGEDSFWENNCIKSLLSIMLLAIAVALRWPNLGELGLWGDEGYSAISAKAILDYGYPALPTGGIYLRSLPFLYAEALSAKMFGLNEFSLRLPSLLANLGAIGMTFLLGRLLFGATVGFLAAVLMTFSGWEIEFARHARMYATLQFLYLASAYVFYRGFLEGNSVAQWLTVPVWILTMIVHELGVVLSVLFLVPLCLKNVSKSERWKCFAGFLGFTFVGLAIGRLVWAVRFATSEADFEADSVATAVLQQAADPVRNLFDIFTTSQRFSYIAVVLGVMAISVIVYRTLRSSDRRWQYLCLIPLVLACMVGQLGVALILLVVYAFVFPLGEDWRRNPFGASLGLVTLSTVVWFASSWASGVSLKGFVRTFFDYPYIYDRFGKFFIAEWPLEMGLAALGATILFLRFIKSRDSRILFGLATVVGPLLVVSLIERGDDGPRYSFHLFPVLLMWMSCAIIYIAKEVIPGKSTSLKIAILVVVLLLLPTDMQLVHGISISQREYGHLFTRPHIASGKAFPFYPDYKTPSELIKKHLREDDLVVIMRGTIPLYYIGRLDYIWVFEEHGKSNNLRLRAIDSDGLRGVAVQNPGRRIWLLTDAFRTNRQQVSGDDLLRSIENCSVCVGGDRHTTVYLFSSDENGELVCVSHA